MVCMYIIYNTFEYVKVAEQVSKENISSSSYVFKNNKRRNIFFVLAVAITSNNSKISFFVSQRLAIKWSTE